MSSRKSIPRSVRLMVYEKCNHRCAYCGCKLEYKDMQVDHIQSVYKHDFEKYRFGNEKLTEEELNSIENYMPACRACNFYKSTFSLEKFRENLTTKLYENLRKNFNYKLLCKYGLIREEIKPIEFYFERMERSMKLGKYLQIMKPTRTYKIECDGASSCFEPEDRIPKMLEDAEVKRCFNDKETGCVVIEIESEEEDDEQNRSK